MRLLIALFLTLCATLSHAATLTLDTGHGTRSLTTAQLLARPDVREITVTSDVSYHTTTHYRAVPMKALLEGVPADAHLQFTALDGFAAELPASLIMAPRGPEAWLAVEPEGKPWPKLGPDKPGAGPFYLVWLHPEAARVGPEQWPYQVVSVKALANPAARFPAMRPAAGLAADHPAMRGFAVFQRNCLTCHTLNGQGNAKLGPDLNIPHSPTEYLRADMLRTLIRNPQDMRHWPQGKMPGFDKNVLTDADLDDLVAYLTHMAGRKVTR